MGKMSRRKGADWELQVAKRLGAWWGATFRRTPMSGGWHKGDAEGKGKLRGDLVQMDGPDFPFCVECKASERWSLEAFLTDPCKNELTAYLRQCWKAARDEGRAPMLVAKRNGRPPVAIIDGAHLPPELPCCMCISFTVDNEHVLACVLLLSALEATAPAAFQRQHKSAVRKRKKGNKNHGTN